MRYLFLLLSLSPVISYAKCIAGVSYGQYPISASNPVCAPYTGSSLGGCFALCGGAAGSSVCVEFPNASPPSKGPYITDGNECTYKDGSDSGSHGNTGGNPSGSDGTNESPTGLVDVGQILVGDKLTTDLGVGFNSVANNVNKSAAKVQKSVKELAKQIEDFRFLDNSTYMDPIKTSLSQIVTNTSGISAGANTNSEMTGYLKTLYDQVVADSVRTETYRSKFIDRFDSLAHTVTLIPKNGSNGGGDGSTAANWQNLSHQLNSLDSWQRIHANTLSQMELYLSGTSYSAGKIHEILAQHYNGDGNGNGNGNGDGGGDGDKPCTGPLCTFTPPSGTGQGSALSSVFDESSIADIKGKVAEKNKAINDKLQEIKSVFKQSDITISGTYDNDYQNIMGAKVDLSGKSNWELFFNSGPRAALWLLAILMAFGILLGGRKNA